jgi:hypothetical protein
MDWFQDSNPGGNVFEYEPLLNMLVQNTLYATFNPD